MLLHGLLLALALSGSLAAAFVRGAGRWRLVLLGLGLTALALLAWSISGAAPAARLAALVAGDRLYCLQTRDANKGYRPVLGLLDLSRLGMWSRRPAPHYHGLLVVKQSDGWLLYNWSHHQQTWDAIPGDLLRVASPTPRCVPRVGYADRLGWRPDRARLAQPRGDFAHVRGRSYMFPAAYDGRASEGDPATLSFATRGLQFEPLGHKASESDLRSLHASLEFSSRDWIENLVKGRPALDLRRLGTSNTGIAALDPHGSMYVARDDQGRVQSVLLCMPHSRRYPASCQHWFYAEGAVWSFRQSPADLPQWLLLELSLRRRIKEFEATGARCEASAC